MSLDSGEPLEQPRAHTQRAQIPAPSDEALRELRLELARAWPLAQKRWSRFLLMAQPTVGHGLRSVAQIHLGTREITLDAPMIVAHQLQPSVEAILAHEIGHHVRFPGTLAAHARLRLLEQSLLPLEKYSLINLFTDLLINEYLGRDLRDKLAAVYQAFHDEITWERDPLFLFYLAIYEELWGMTPGELMGPGWETFAQKHPSYRADAQIVGQTIFHLGPNLYTQFLYFLSVAVRYLDFSDLESLLSADPYDCIFGEPGPEDWADALVPNAREREAVERALKEGWIKKEDGERIVGEGNLERRIFGLPGQGTADASAVPDIMAAYYRQQAEQYLMRPPPIPSLGEAVVPTTHEAWEPGDPVQDIDWLGTFLQRGSVLGAVQPLRRTRIAEIEGYEVPFWQPRVEIYLDVSGSMPDPRRSHNAMTLASQILTLGAVRAGGWARALLYSSDYVSYWQWCRSEIEISRFLLHYIGGGTKFPFEVLRRSVEDSRRQQPVRAIITDMDFVHNYDAGLPETKHILTEACATSPGVVLLLHAVSVESAAQYRRCGAQIVHIDNMEDFPRMAAHLSHALFAGKSDRRHHGTF